MNEDSDRQTNPAPISEVDYYLQFFAYEHLPPHLQAVSKPFGDLARNIAGVNMPAGTPVQFPLPAGPMRIEALDLLIKAKDAAVRALVAK